MASRKTKFAIIFLVSVILSLPVSGITEEKGGRQTISLAGKSLKLIGRGTREFLFIDIYKMAAYSESGNCTIEEIIKKNEIKTIRLSMIHEIPAERMNTTLRESLIKSMKNKNDAQLRRNIDTFLAFFKEDLSVGTFVEIIYVPGAGTIAKRDGKKLGVVPGQEFHELVWSSYFGTDTCCETLKKTIIEACNQK